jgi:hypothetical protein
MDRSTPPRASSGRVVLLAGRRPLRADGGRENDEATDSEEDEGAEGSESNGGSEGSNGADDREDREAREARSDGDDRAAEGSTDDGDEEKREGEGKGKAKGNDGSNVERAGVEVTEAGEAEPADPKWEPPDLDDLPEFELRADEPVARSESGGLDAADDPEGSENPTAGMPNTAQVPGTRLKEEGTEGYVAALELCARLPEDVRLPEQAADLVPAAVEAELEQDVQSFAAAEFDNASPHVETLAFVERDGEVWFRLRLGVSPEAFADLDPEAIRTHALQQLEGMF